MVAVTSVLVLAGTSEATELATVLVRDHGADVLSSLAGVTTSPVPRPGRVRRGGFGGTDGLVAHLRDAPVDAIIDATHPFAAVMPHHVAAAAAATGTPSCRLLRPAWQPVPGDRWIEVDDLAAAAEALVALGAARPLVTTGSRSIDAFSSLDAQVVVRAIEVPDVLAANHELILARGPFALEDELALLREHRIDAVVTKNSGGTATAAKLVAARRLDLPVVMVGRPAQPSVPIVPDVDHARAWLVAEVAASSPYQRGV